MKVKAEMIIDAEPRVVWRALEAADDLPSWRPTTVTEEREPHFFAGVHESGVSKAIVVNHFDKTDDDRTHWVVYANHQFHGLQKLLAVFRAASIRRQTEEDMQRFKLLVESRIAEGSQ